MPRNGTADRFVIVVTLAGLLYAALAWTPSSYGALFDHLALPREGLVLGEPRAIREDEWVRWTPFFQAAVRNDFERVNRTSLYREDLRNVEGLPVKDAWMVFKPYFWPFLWMEPAYAFSSYHAFWMALFLIGYHRLFRRLGSSLGEAAGASLALFFSLFVQAWWTTYGPILAGFPCLLLVALAPFRSWVRLPALAYATTSWLLADLYPPLQISLGFAAVVTILSLQRSELAARRMLATSMALALGSALALFHYRDVFVAMAGTIYPGQRVSSGGSVPLFQWLAQVLPFLVVRGWEPLVQENVCEASTPGTFLPLLVLGFVDYRALWARILGRGADARIFRRSLGGVALGLVAITLWMLAPLPAAVGRPLLWHLVPPKRMLFASGFLIVVLSLQLLRHVPLTLTWYRAAWVGGLAVAGWLASRRGLAGGTTEATSLVSLVLCVAALAAWRPRSPSVARPVLVGFAALANLIAFGGFNPIQSAVPIFEPRLPVVAESLDRLAGRHPRGWLVLEGEYGAWLNGQGYASAAHVLLAPELDRFRSLLPELEEPRLRELFNRALYVQLTPRVNPFLLAESTVAVPIDSFDPPTIRVDLGAPSSADVRRGGAIESSEMYGEDGRTYVLLRGWAILDGSAASSRLVIDTDLPVEAAVAYPSLRPEIARRFGDSGLALAGFSIRLLLATKPGDGGAGGTADGGAARGRVCIVSEDDERGRRLLHGNPTAPCSLPGSGGREQ